MPSSSWIKGLATAVLITGALLVSFQAMSGDPSSRSPVDEIRLLRADLAASGQKTREASNEMWTLRTEMSQYVRKFDAVLRQVSSATNLTSPKSMLLEPGQPIEHAAPQPCLEHPLSLGALFLPTIANATHNASSISRKESLGFFDYSDADWTRKKSIVQYQNRRQIATGVSRYLDGRTFYQGNWEPNWSCGYEARIGKAGDGGKWVCDPFRIAEKPANEECYILSVGSENDFSFEAEIHKVNPRCIIHTLDHTMQPSRVPPYVKFHKWGLGKSDVGPMRTIPSILKELGLWKKHIDILKIDCEGCEFNVFPQFFWNEGFFRQILIEMHYSRAPAGFQQPQGQRTMQKNPAFPHSRVTQMNHDMFNAFKRHGYVIFHKEPNIQHAGGDCTEFSFLKLDLPPL